LLAFYLFLFAKYSKKKIQNFKIQKKKKKKKKKKKGKKEKENWH
jgi:hypothetical protein